MRAVFATLLMKERLNEPVPLTILAFKNDKNYYQSAPLRQGQPIDVPGFFLPGEDQNFIVLNLLEEESWCAVAHDFAHLLLNYNYPAPVVPQDGSTKAWPNTSVRSASTTRSTKSAATQNCIPQISGNAPNPPKSLTELLAGQVWLALPDLLTMKRDTSTYTEGTHHTLFYAQSWMVMHYLLHEKKLPADGNLF